MKQKPVKITETVLRDGHQSIAATRMRTSDMLPTLEQLDDIGYFSIEAWGGATFDACLRFLNEDPWQRLRTIKSHLKKTPVQMLLRGQNLLGYNPYPDDVVIEFVNRCVANGVGVIRIFDALNDVRNLETAMRTAKTAGAHVQGTIVYTISPFHTLDEFVKTAINIADIGADSICIKDMAGMLAPMDAFDLVQAIKKALPDKLLQLHCHYTSGMAGMTYLKAIDAGIDIIDCSLSPFAMASSQPATESMIAALENHPRCTLLDKEKLFPVAKHFRQIKKDLVNEFKLNSNIDIDVEVLKFQIPGGMLSNLLNQMKEMGMEDRYADLLAEMPIVRAELGYPPLVTPTSQIVGSQAAFNVMLGRYVNVCREVKDLALGKFGRTPQPIDSAFLNKIAPNEQPFTGRFADQLPAKLDKLKTELHALGYLNASIEDVLSYAVFPEVALQYFAKRDHSEHPPLIKEYI